MEIKAKGIDVSAHQGEIDWQAVAGNGIQFAIIRAGYGKEASQKDRCFDRNMKGALAVGIGVGAYWFSYATNVAEAVREAELFLQVMEPYRGRVTYPLCFDWEYDSDRYARMQGVLPTPSLITDMATAFLSTLEKAGYYAMNYANTDYMRNKLDRGRMARFDLWLADYNGSPEYPCGIQQTGSTGKVSGVKGNCDMDVAYKDYPALIRPVSANPPGSDPDAEPDPAPAPAPTPAPRTVDVYYRVATAKHGWLPEVTNLEDYAGWQDSPVTKVAIRVSAGRIKYRAHIEGGKWLPWVEGCDIDDHKNGYAGNGRAIDAVEVYYYTPDDIRPYKRAKYRVAAAGRDYYDWQLDNQTTNGQDGYAGAFGRAITRLQIVIV